MKLIDLILRRKKPLLPSKKQLKIKIKTDKKGKIKIFDSETNQRITDISRISLYVNSFGKVCAELSIKDVELDIEVGNVELRKGN